MSRIIDRSETFQTTLVLIDRGTGPIFIGSLTTAIYV